MLSEISQTERQILFDVTYMWNLKKMQHTSEQNRKAADRLTDTENKQVVSSGEGRLGVGGGEVGGPGPLAKGRIRREDLCRAPNKTGNNPWPSGAQVLGKTVKGTLY